MISGLRSSHRIEAEAHPVDRAGTKVLDHDVRRLSERPGELAFAVIFEVELYGVDIGVKGRVGRCQSTPRRQRVHDKFVGRFDLDDRGAKLGEQR